MLKDIQNSIKAKLYDFTYTPFMSSMVIAWIILNHKYILIYMATYDLDEKLMLLNEYSFSSCILWFDLPFAMNVIFPIIFGLFYTFLYPIVSEIFYKYTLERTKELKKIKQSIEDETPITQEEARGIRGLINELTTERNELQEKLVSVEKRYTEDNQIEISKLKVLKETKKEVKKKEDDKTKILRYFYESNYSEESENDLLDDLYTKLKMARPKIQKVINNLISEGILLCEEYDSTNYIDITEKGNTILLAMFDKEI
jgi:hypothetical protein